MNPLSTKQRLRSLLILVAVFVLIAPVILLYSLGYRLDDKLTLQKTGGIFIHSDVTNSTVFVDGEFLRDNGIFVRNTWIQDLTPNKYYKVEFHKDGFQSWVKELRVYPSIVTEGRVLMLPNQFQMREILPHLVSAGSATTSTAQSGIPAAPANKEFIAIAELFATSTDEIEDEKSATSTATTTVAKQKGDLELFFETLLIEDYQALENLIVNGKEVSWLSDGNINLHWTSDISSIPYYYCGGDERACQRSIVLDWGDDIERFEYMPGRDDIWVALVKGGIYAIEVDGRTQRNIQQIYKGENLDFRLTQNDRIILKDGTRFFEISL